MNFVLFLYIEWKRKNYRGPKLDDIAQPSFYSIMVNFLAIPCQFSLYLSQFWTIP